MQIEYKRLESMDEVDALVAMATEHYSECETRAVELPFSLDLEQLREMHANGTAELFVAYNDKTPVGYLLAAIVPDVMTDEVIGQLIAMYTEPGERGGGIATGLINLFEDTLKFYGKATCILSFKTGNKVMLPETLGYEQSEISFTKVIHGDDNG